MAICIPGWEDKKIFLGYLQITVLMKEKQLNYSVRF